MNEPTRRYRHPRDSNYTKASWWAGHGAELVGAVAGFLVGLVLFLVVEAAAPATDLSWLPWLLLVAGALGLRAVVRRQFHD